MRSLERWLFAPGSAERLAALRIGLCSLLAFRLTTGSYLELAEQPDALFRPISFMQLLPGMPPRNAVLALQLVGVLAALLAALGLRARATLPLAWACGVFLMGMTTSTGKVVHNDVPLLLCLVPLLVARTSDAWSLDRRRKAGPGSPFRPLRLAGPDRGGRRRGSLFLRRPREAREFGPGLGDERQHALDPLRGERLRGRLSSSPTGPGSPTSSRPGRWRSSSASPSCSGAPGPPGSSSPAQSRSTSESGSRWAWTTPPRRRRW